MNFLRIIKSRRSIRTYQNKKIPKKTLLKIIEAGRWAPSACNRQGWRFLIIDDQQLKDKLVTHGTAWFVKDAPHLILVLYDNRTDNIEYQDHIQSAAACIQNMLLAAHSLGIGSCWVANLPPKKELRKIFEIPKYFEPIALVTFGYPKKKPKYVKRLHKLKDIVWYNKVVLRKKYLTPRYSVLRKFLRKLYFKLPFFIRKILVSHAKKFEWKFD